MCGAECHGCRTGSDPEPLGRSRRTRAYAQDHCSRCGRSYSRRRSRSRRTGQQGQRCFRPEYSQDGGKGLTQLGLQCGDFCAQLLNGFDEYWNHATLVHGPATCIIGFGNFRKNFGDILGDQTDVLLAWSQILPLKSNWLELVDFSETLLTVFNFLFGITIGHVIELGRVTLSIARVHFQDLTCIGVVSIALELDGVWSRYKKRRVPEFTPLCRVKFDRVRGVSKLNISIGESNLSKGRISSNIMCHSSLDDHVLVAHHNASNRVRCCVWI